MTAPVPTLPCPECGSALILKDGAHGKFYGCSQFRWTGCTGSHSAHQESGKPMGIPTKQEVKTARHRAHRSFDEIWITGRMTRKQAYEWMAKIMQLTKRDAHIAKMDIPQCEKLMGAIHDLGKRR